MSIVGHCFQRVWKLCCVAKSYVQFLLTFRFWCGAQLSSWMAALQVSTCETARISVVSVSPCPFCHISFTNCKNSSKLCDLCSFFYLDKAYKGGWAWSIMRDLWCAASCSDWVFPGSSYTDSHWHQCLGSAQCLPFRLPICLRSCRHCLAAQPVRIDPFITRSPPCVAGVCWLLALLAVPDVLLVFLANQMCPVISGMVKFAASRPLWRSWMLGDHVALRFKVYH